MKDINVDILDYDPNRSYTAKEIVLFNGGLYQAKNDIPKHDWLSTDWISLSDIGQSYIIVDSFNKFNNEKTGLSSVTYNNNVYQYNIFSNNTWNVIPTNFKNLMVIVKGYYAQSATIDTVVWKPIKYNKLVLFDNNSLIVDDINIDFVNEGIQSMIGSQPNENGIVTLDYADTDSEVDGFVKSTATTNLRFNNGVMNLISKAETQYSFDVIVDDIKHAPFVGSAGKTLLDLSTGEIYHSEFRNKYQINFSELKNHFDQYSNLKRRITEFSINRTIEPPVNPDGTILSSDISSKIPMIYCAHDFEDGDCTQLDNWQDSFWFIYDFMSDANYKPRYIGAYGDSTEGVTSYFYKCDDKDHCYWHTYGITPEHPLYPICIQDISNSLFNDEQLAMRWRSYIDAAFVFFVEGFFWFKNKKSDQITFTPDVLIYGGNDVLATFGLDSKFHSILTEAPDEAVWVTDYYHNVSPVPIDTGDLVETDITGPLWKFEDDQEIIITGSIKRSDGSEIFVHEKQNSITIPEFNLSLYLWDDKGTPKVDYHHFILDTDALDYWEEPYIRQFMPNRDLCTPIIMANYHKAQFVQAPYINYSIDDNTLPNFNITIWNTYWGVPQIDALNNEYEDAAGKKWSCQNNIKVEEIILEDQWHKNDKDYKPLVYDIRPLPIIWNESQDNVDKSESRGIFTKHGTINVTLPENIRNKPAHFVIKAKITDTTHKKIEYIYDTVTYIPAQAYPPTPASPQVIMPINVGDDPDPDKFTTRIKIIGFSQEMGITKMGFFCEYKKGSRWYPIGDYDGEVELKLWGGEFQEQYKKILHPLGSMMGTQVYYWQELLPESENAYWYQIVYNNTDKYTGFEHHDHFIVAYKEAISLYMNGSAVQNDRYNSIRLEIQTMNNWGHPYNDIPVKVSVSQAYIRDDELYPYKHWDVYTFKTGPDNNEYDVDPGCINVDLPLEKDSDHLQSPLYIVKAEIVEDVSFYYSCVTMMVSTAYPTSSGTIYFKDAAKQGCYITAGSRVKVHTPMVPQIGIKPFMDIGKRIGHDDVYQVHDFHTPTVIADTDGNEFKNWLQALYDDNDVNHTNPVGYTLASSGILVSPPLSSVSLDILLQQTYNSPAIPPGWKTTYPDSLPEMGPESQYYPEMYNFTVIAPESGKFIKVKKVFDPYNIRAKHLPIPTLDGDMNLLVIEFLGNRYIAPQTAIVPIIQIPSLFTLLTVSPMNFVITPIDNNTIIFDIRLTHWDRSPFGNQEIIITAGYQRNNGKYTGTQDKVTLDSEGYYRYIYNIPARMPEINDIKDQEYGNVFFKFNYLGHVVDEHLQPLPWDDVKLPSAKFIEGIYYKHNHTGSIPTRITGNPTALSFSPEELCDIGFGTHYSFDVLMEYYDSTSSSWKPLANKEFEYTMSNFNNGVLQAKGGMRQKIKTDEYGYYTWQLGYIKAGGFGVDAKVINIRNNIDEGYLSFVYQGDNTYNYCIATTQIHGCAGRFPKSHDCLGYISQLLAGFSGFVGAALTGLLGGWTSKLIWDKNYAKFQEYTANRNVELMTLVGEEVQMISTRPGMTVMEQFDSQDVDAVFRDEDFVNFLRDTWSAQAAARGVMSAEIPAEYFVTSEDGYTQLRCGLPADRFRRLAARVCNDPRFVRPPSQPMFKDVTYPTHEGDSVESCTTGTKAEVVVAQPRAPLPKGTSEQRVFQELFPTPIPGAPKLSSAFETSAEPLLVKLGIEKQTVPVEVPIPTYPDDANPSQPGAPGPAHVEVPAVKSARWNLVCCDPKTGEPILAFSILHDSEQTDQAKTMMLNAKERMELGIRDWMRTSKGFDDISALAMKGRSLYPSNTFVRLGDQSEESMIWCIRECAYKYFRNGKITPQTPASDRVQAEIYDEMRNVGYVFRTLDIRVPLVGREKFAISTLNSQVFAILMGGPGTAIPNQGARLWTGLNPPKWNDWDPSWKP